MTHTLSIDTGYGIDLEWVNAGMPDDGLRVVSYYLCGNHSRTFLTIPDDETAPRYEYTRRGWQHVSGPTLDEWQRTQDEAEFMAQWQEAYIEARELYEVASGR